MHATKSSGFGTSAITETELRSFFLNRRITPSDMELRLLTRLDRVSMDDHSKKPVPKEEE